MIIRTNRQSKLIHLTVLLITWKSDAVADSWSFVKCIKKKKRVSSVLTRRCTSVTNGAEQKKPLQQKTLSTVKKLLQKRLNARGGDPRPSQLKSLRWFKKNRSMHLEKLWIVSNLSVSWQCHIHCLRNWSWKTAFSCLLICSCRDFLSTPQKDSSAARSVGAVVVYSISIYEGNVDAWWRPCLCCRSPVQMSSLSSRNFRTVSLSAAPTGKNPGVGNLWVFAHVWTDLNKL